MQDKCKPVYFICFFLFCLSVCLLQSCSIVKNYPQGKPFVYNNRIVVDKENISKDEKKRLTLELENYWEDSLRARKSTQWLFWQKLKNPPVFDTVNISRSVTFMNGYMNSQGYYHTSFTDTFYVDTFKKELRTTVVINVHPRKNLVIDSVSYDFSDTTLRRIALEKQSQKESLVRKGKPFSNQIITAELDRLVFLFRQKGYYFLSRDNLVAEVDTMDRSLFELTLDPFEQAQRIAEAMERRKNNPSINISFKQKNQLEYGIDSTLKNDTAFLKQFHIASVSYYPETKVTELPDDIIKNPPPLVDKRRSFSVYYTQGKFKPDILRDFNYLRRGNLYNEELYFKVINNLSNVGAWAEVDGRPVVRGDSLDMHYFLIPAIKQNITFDLEASRNTGDVISSSNLFGLGANITYRNRNAFKRAIQSATSMNGGVELSFGQTDDFLQTLQGAVGQSFTFPRFIIPFRPRGTTRLDGIKTIFAINGSYTDRRNFFTMRSLVTNWGYEWKKRNKVWQYKLLNIELNSLDTLPKLDTAFKTNPFLRTAFNTGSVVSQILTYNVSYTSPHNPTHTNFIRLSIEEAGGLLGRIPALRDEIYQYVKLEGEYRRRIQFKKSTLALRAFAGVGFNYSNTPGKNKTLPFYKQFIAGGPNSMRAWVLRQLGLGSSLLSDTSGGFRDRFGDMQLEANAEYRFNVASIGSMKIGSALFIDAGNIWNLKKDSLNPNSEFSIPRLGKDIAIGIGTGLRLDFDYFLLRLDFGIKLKDPARLDNNGWLNLRNFTWKNEEFVVKDPNTGKIVNRNNYAFQLGINLPF